VIALAVRWYVRYRLRYADVVEWLAERGITVDRSTIYRWVQHFLPFFREAARAHRHPVGAKWRVDETYIRLHGRWTYLYRAIDQDRQVVDVYFSERRNATAAEAFFKRAIDETDSTPVQVTTDKAKWYPPALRAVLPHAKHRTSKVLHNAVERDHVTSNNGSIPCVASSKQPLPISSPVGMRASKTCEIVSPRSAWWSHKTCGS
jgi:transposase-like protein